MKEDIKLEFNSKVEEMKTTTITEHLKSVEELEEMTQTRINRLNPKLSQGLLEEEADQRLLRDGKNELTAKKPIPLWLKFLKQFIEFFPLLLEIGGILCFIAYGLDKSTKDNLYLGIILWIVVIVTAVFSFQQEAKSANIMEGFKKFSANTCVVIREGTVKNLDAANLVVGDIVLSKAGDRIPADLRLIYCQDFKVDNSALTGEAEAQKRSIENTDTSALETQNLAFSTTLVVEGEAVGVVIRTGDATMIGAIAHLVSETKRDQSPLKKEIARFVKIISAVALTLGLIFLIVGFAVKLNWVFIVVFVIGVVVANVPEGLLPTLTVSLSLTAKKLGSKMVHVKNLDAVETLGSCSTIASDKTGTLTQNRMSVEHMWYNSSIYTVLENSEEERYNDQNPSFVALVEVAILCNRAVFDFKNELDREIPLKERKTIGDASESALIKFCEDITPIIPYREVRPKLVEIPFNSTNKWQLSIHQTENGRLLVMKGAAERVIQRCSHYLENGNLIPLDESFLDKFNRAYEHFAGLGERVFGFARLHLPSEYDTTELSANHPNFPMEGLTFLGMMCLMDPPKEKVKEAIASCKLAGVRVVMVTGDHPLTAATIARNVGIFEASTLDTIDTLRIQISHGAEINSPETRRRRWFWKRKKMDLPIWEYTHQPFNSQSISNNDIIIKGHEIEGLTSQEWDFIYDRRNIVFARTSPQQKLLIVENFQNRGEIVAVTGDGVNDSPALKKSDLGCSMGISGSEVSKDAADIILLDDNFASIVTGVEEGRIVYDNLKKSICYTLSSNFAELLPFIAFIVLRLPLALSAILILCIDIGTDMLTAISFAYENPESDIMRRKPRKPTDRLVNLKLVVYSYAYLGLFQACSGFTNYFYVMHQYGINGRDLFGKGFEYFVLDGNSGDFQGYTPDQQIEILREAQTGFFVGVVVVRIFVAVCCKTRLLSVFQQGFKNKVFLAGIVVEIILIVALTYIPGIQTAFGTKPLSWEPWIIALGYGILLFACEEVRKLWIRRFPKGIVKKITYW